MAAAAGDDLKDGARRKAAGEGVVQVHALVGLVGLQILGDGVGVKGGGADLGQNLPRLVVVDNDSAVFPAQGVVGGHAGVLVDGQRNVAAHAVEDGVVEPGDDVVAGELGPHGVLHAGGDVAIGVPHGVEQGAADGFVLAVEAGAVFGGGKEVAVPVGDVPQLHSGILRIDVAVIGLHGPLAAVYHKLV